MLSSHFLLGVPNKHFPRGFTTELRRRKCKNGIKGNGDFQGHCWKSVIKDAALISCYSFKLRKSGPWMKSQCQIPNELFSFFCCISCFLNRYIGEPSSSGNFFIFFLESFTLILWRRVLFRMLAVTHLVSNMSELCQIKISIPLL